MNVLSKTVKYSNDAFGTLKASTGGFLLPKAAFEEFNGRGAPLRVREGKTKRPCRRIIFSGVLEPSRGAVASALIDPIDMPLTPIPSPALGRGEPILTCMTEPDVVSVRRFNPIPITDRRTAGVARRNSLLLLASLLLGAAFPLLVWA